ncbi:hypothetical protein PUN28_017425 [Cardiocondyla obscurior]|uniref:Uncharacterized protein n=1 Tax=Cardiocondyla obscurior TaxID=286306 RepID=A0AAW2ENU6_9HYME
MSRLIIEFKIRRQQKTLRATGTRKGAINNCLATRSDATANLHGLFSVVHYSKSKKNESSNEEQR